ncbi:MAG: prepilin peptidase [Phycisphaerales bacterium JB063]
MPIAINILAYVALLGVGAAASVTDVRTKLIPNKLTFPAMLAGLAFWAIAGLVMGKGLLGSPLTEPGTLSGAWIAMFLGLVPFILLVFIGGLGMGDAKLMGAVGAISCQWQVVVGTTIYALVVALVMGLCTMVLAGRVRLTMYRLLGIALSAGKVIKPDDSESAPTVPFAVAIAVGAALAGAELMVGLWPKNPWIWP